MRRTYCSVLLFLCLLGLFSACGGGGGGGGGEENLNSLFDGEYRYIIMEDEEGTSSREVRFFTSIADGAGNASAILGTATVGLVYDIAPDRTMSLGPAIPDAFETSQGIINFDGSFLATTDAYRGDVSGDDVELSVAVAKSSLAGTAGVAGTFIVGQAGFNQSSDFYVSRVLVTINADASAGSYWILGHSDESAVGSSGSFSLAFSTDGTFTIDNGNGVDYGIFSPDQNMFAIADTTGGDSDGEKILAVGVRLSTAGTPDGIGEYVINQIGMSAPLTTQTIYTSRVEVTNSIDTFDFLVTASSMGPPLGSGSGIAYSLSADGTVMFPGNSGWVANLSPDGKVMVLVDSDPETAEEIHFGVAIKK